jgi:multidrug efflux system membrane fusion protein
MDKYTGIPSVVAQRFPPSAANFSFGSKLKTLLSSLSLLLLLDACDSHNQPPAAQAGLPAPDVKIAQPLNRNVTDWDEFTGRVEAINAVDIRARVGGHLEKVNFKAGAKVTKGDLLFQIDPKPFKAQFNYATAELERAKSRQELAKNDLRRAENLFKEKAISAEEFDMRSKGLREATAAVESAEANLYSARINLDYCEIRAPISGRISRELISAGNLVTGGDTTVLTSIVSTDPVYVYVDADEQALLKYRRQTQQQQGSSDLRGTPVELALADETDYPHQGHIDFVSPREDTATGTVTLRSVFSNQDELLSPGFFAHIRVRSGAPYPALLVPDRAIATDQAQRFVWVIDADQHVAYRKVVPGTRMGQMRVITSGLQAEDWLVVDGIQKLKPGLQVKPEKISLSELQGAQ